MRHGRSRARACERAQELSSRRLDGDLSPFEDALLDAHLGACPACREFADGLSGVVAQLRSAPLELPERLITLPERRRRLASAVRVGAVAAAAAAAVAAFVPALVGNYNPRSAQRARIQAAIASANNQDIQDLHLILANRKIPERAFLIAHGRGPRP